MKRIQERDSSPRSKRSRSSYSDLEPMMRERMSPDFDRRDMRGREMKQKYRDPRDFHDDIDYMPPKPKFRDDRMDGGSFGQSRESKPEYRSLCISNISSKIPDKVLKDTLYRDFEKFGEYNVNITYKGEKRVAYINFRYPSDAKIAKHAKSKMLLYDRPVHIEAVYNTQGKNESHNSGGGGGHMDMGGDRGRDYGMHMSGGSYRGSSPPPFRGGRSGNGSHGGYGRPSSMRGSYSDRDGLPPPPPPHHRSERSGGYMGDSGGGYQGNSYNQKSQRRAPNEKFPYHLDHINPEDDEKATRTLFVGNLDYNIEADELNRVFGRFGPLEDIDIKRPQRGQGNAYAFIKFMILDHAHRAKVETSGTYIGRFQCKIGYGKANPTTCLWVGGLGSWVTPESLEREFDRFGVIDKIEWPHGKNYAYVVYGNIDAAIAACQGMRGFPMGGPSKKLRVDFADASHISGTLPPVTVSRESPSRDPPGPYRQMDGHSESGRSRRDDWRPDEFANQDSRDAWERSERSRPRSHADEFDRPMPGRSPDRYERMSNPDRSRSRDRRTSPIDPRDHPRGSYSDRRNSESDPMEAVTNIAEMSQCLPVAWKGALILKKSAYGAKMHVVSGDVTIVDTMMRDPTTTETPVLKISQRLRLEQPKMEDVGRRVASAGPRGSCVLLAMSAMLDNYEDTSVQQRALKYLVAYLKQKDAAGVISLPSYDARDREDQGVLYAFPPCQFAYDYLKARSPRLSNTELDQDDFMIIVVIKGAV